MMKVCLPLLLCMLLLPQVARAQAVPTAAGTAETPPIVDALGRDTPRGTLVGLIAAVEEGNLDRAEEYLASGLRNLDRRELARQLGEILDRKLLGLERISNDPRGDPDDGLATRDRVGLIDSPSGSVEIMLDRVQRAREPAVWLFSAGLLREIPRLYEELEPRWIERYVPERLRKTRWLSLPLYRWLAILLTIPLVFALAALCTRLLTRAINPVFRRLTRDHYEQTLVTPGPLRLLVLAAFFYVGAMFGLSLATRHFWHRVAETLMVVALAWLAIRVADMAAKLSLARLRRAERSGDIALVLLINRLLKAAAVILALLALLYLSDVDLTAALTGLGVGGLAIGFGAQKTIENLFGGIMVISDKPVNVGDVCRVGEFFGTVEDIGIRSTRIRTLERTVVSVPNGQLAIMSLENFGVRDRIRFHHTVALGRQTTAAQLRSVLDQIRRLLDADPRVESESARARFIRLGMLSLDLEIFAYVLEREHTAFLAVQEELLLAIVDILEASGTSFAFPAAAAPFAQAGLVGP